jgi:hypothetical protein
MDFLYRLLVRVQNAKAALPPAATPAVPATKGKKAKTAKKPDPAVKLQELADKIQEGIDKVRADQDPFAVAKKAPAKKKKG